MSDQTGKEPDQLPPDSGSESAGGRTGSQAGKAIQTSLSANSPMPFEGLAAPIPTSAAPPPKARWLAFVGILVGGLLGGLIGYGIGDIVAESSTAAALGALIAGTGCAVGVGIVASLTLRAMNEWHVTNHPEDPRNDPSR